MSKDAEVYDALATRAGTMVLTTPALPVAYPDLSFDPATDAPSGKYVEVSFFPNRPAWEGIATGALKQGLLQITVVWPRGSALPQGEEAGIGPPLAIADLVTAHFAKGTVMVSGTTKVKVSREPWVSPPLTDAAETRVPVSISWTA